MGKLIMLRMEAASGNLPNDPFLIRKSVELHLGTGIEGGFPENKGATYALKVRNSTHATKLKQLTELIGGTKITINDHPTLNQTRCIIFCEDTLQYSDDGLLRNLESQDVIAIRRITKREGEIRKNTPMVILTVKGTTMPEHINIGFIRCKTRVYYPSPMLCFGCWKFGHTAARCPTKEILCGHCSGSHVVVSGVRCMNDPYCNRCESSNHPLSSRKCPTYVTENEIQHSRIDLGISYPAAKKLHEQRADQTSAAAVVNASNETRINELSAKMELIIRQLQLRDQKIDLLMRENAIQTEKLAEKDVEIAELKAALKSSAQDRKNKPEPAKPSESPNPSKEPRTSKDRYLLKKQKAAKLKATDSVDGIGKRSKNNTPQNSESDEEMDEEESPQFQPIGDLEGPHGAQPTDDQESFDL